MPPKAQYQGRVQNRAMVPPMNTSGPRRNLPPKHTVLLKALSFNFDFTISVGIQMMAFTTVEAMK